jgi:hypothetical protein
MTSANGHDSRLGEARIQGDKQGCFADRAYDSQAFARDAQTAASSTGSPGRSSMPAIRSRPGGKSTTPGRGACAQPLSALSRALVRYLGACAQRLPSAVHRRGDELEAGARADARDLGGRGSNPSAVPRYDSHPKTRQNRRQPSLLSQTMQSQRKSAPSAKLSVVRAKSNLPSVLIDKYMRFSASVGAEDFGVADDGVCDRLDAGRAGRT